MCVCVCFGCFRPSLAGLFRSGTRDPEGEDIDLLAESDLYRCMLHVALRYKPPRPSLRVRFGLRSAKDSRTSAQRESR